MPTEAVRAHLNDLYTLSDDPWSTHASAYERAKFAATIGSLTRPRYRHCLEVGCGAGALTSLLAQRCDALTAMDCTPGALAVARAHASGAGVAFIEGCVPEAWPASAPDLVMLSEVLYFMTDKEALGLASLLARKTLDDCEIVLVNWLGDTGGAISGAAAAQRLIGLVSNTYRRITTHRSARFRIDVLQRADRAAYRRRERTRLRRRYAVVRHSLPLRLKDHRLGAVPRRLMRIQDCTPMAQRSACAASNGSSAQSGAAATGSFTIANKKGLGGCSKPSSLGRKRHDLP